MSRLNNGMRCIKRSIGMLLCLTMLMGAYNLHLIPTPSVHAENTVEELTSQKDALAKQQQELAQKRDESVASLEDQKQQSEIIKQQIKAKSSEIAINKQLLETLDEQIAAKTAAIATHEDTIQTLDAQIATQQEELRARLRRVSKKSGVTTFVQVILNSRNYADYLIGFKMSEQLSTQSEKLMQEIEQNIRKVEAVRNQAKTDKAALEIERTQAKQVQTELEDGKASLQTLYAESNALSEAMSQDIHYLNEQIAAIDAQQASLQGTIDNVLEQIRLKEEAEEAERIRQEEERRRQEEAAKTSTTTTSTTTTTKTTTKVTTIKTTTTITTTVTTTLTTTTTTDKTTTMVSSDQEGDVTITSTTDSETTTTKLDKTTITIMTTSGVTTTTTQKTTTTKKTTTTTETTTKKTTTTTKPKQDDASDDETDLQPDPYAFAMLWPTPSCDVITSSFKYREQFGRWHNGVDIASYGDTEGEPIVAAASGTVCYANRFDTWGDGYGLYLIIDHGEDAAGRRILTIYAHCSEVSAYEGLEVEAGDVIAYVGDTGNSYGAHLHFEVQVDGTAVDPVINGYLSVEGIDILG